MIARASLPYLVSALALALAGCGSDDGKAAEDGSASASEAASTVAAAATPAAADTPETPADVTIGSNPLLPVGSPPLEIMGIRLGASLDQARSQFGAARKENSFTKYVESVDTLPAPSKTRFLTSLYADKNDAKPGFVNNIGALLVGPPNAPQVWFVARHITYGPSDGPSVASSVKSLTDKYGEPHFSVGGKPRAYGADLYWFWTSDGKPAVEGKFRECTSKLSAMAPYGDPPSNAATRYGAIRGGTEFAVQNSCARGLRAIIQARNDIVHDFQIGVTDFDLGGAGNVRTAEMLKGAVDSAQQQALQAADQRAPDF